jgi:preprotein translocase subunit SecG
MVTFLTGLHVVVCVFLIIVVLLQAGKGGGMGIAFGGGGSQTVFGSSGAGNFLTKLTSATAFLFLVTSLGLAHYSSQQDSKRLQRLAERTADEKKVEDERAAKLKSELDKAREAAQKKLGGTDLAPASNASEMPPAALGAGKPRAGNSDVLKLGDLKLAAPKAGGEKSAAAGTGPSATEEPAKPAKPKRKRRAAPPADGETSAAPAAPAPPAEAPAAPAQ